ncbi:MAG: ribosome-associated translation inhibitor RaiA [Coriobacteriia bacterium]|nr:ribosome-associated translation inhibitor RaiA [Coriobacteriia bacterium]
MNITITGRRMSVNEELHDHVDHRLANATKVFQIDPMDVEVVLRRDTRASREVSTCEITLRTKGNIIRTEATDEEIRAAIDIATAKLERQLRKYKTRVIDRRQRAPRLSEAIEQAIPDQILTDEDEFVEEDDEQLIRVKEIDLDMLNTQQALLQMDLLGHDFFLYVSAEDGLPAVMYRRNEGGYGVIRPRVEQEEG